MKFFQSICKVLKLIILVLAPETSLRHKTEMGSITDFAMLALLSHHGPIDFPNLSHPNLVPRVASSEFIEG
jgi:hypothetical protein